MSVVYSIRDWDRHFENAQSRKLTKAMSWVPTPCKHDGKSFRRIMAMEEGLSIYGAWILIVQVAAKCPIRGVLADQDGPLTVDDLAIKTGCRAEFFARALNVLSNQNIGWLVVGQWESAGRPLPPQDKEYRELPTNQPTQFPIVSQNSPESCDDSETAGGLAGGNGFGFAKGWATVADKLTALGASRWREAISEAKAAGCHPGLALEIIAYAKAKNFGVGAVIYRLARARPSLPLAEGWPEKPDGPKQTPAQRQAKRKEQDESRAMGMIRAAKRAGMPPEVIKQELAAAGLECPEWFEHPPEPLTDDEKRKFKALRKGATP